MKTAILALAVSTLPLAASAETWEAKGKYYETCDCAVSCACATGAFVPTEGHCDSVNLFHLGRAAVGKTRLDGLKFAIVFKSPEGKKLTESWNQREMEHFVLYLDEKATESQRKVFPRLVEGMLGKLNFQGAHPPEYVAFKLATDAESATMDIAGGKLVADIVKINAEPRHGGKPRHLKLEGVVAWPFVTGVVQGRSNRFTYDDGETKWSYKDRNAFFGSFSARGEVPEAEARLR